MTTGVTVADVVAVIKMGAESETTCAGNEVAGTAAESIRAAALGACRSVATPRLAWEP
jgi:hypothetical protein